MKKYCPWQMNIIWVIMDFRLSVIYLWRKLLNTWIAFEYMSYIHFSVNLCATEHLDGFGGVKLNMTYHQCIRFRGWQSVTRIVLILTKRPNVPSKNMRYFGVRCRHMNSLLTSYRVYFLLSDLAKWHTQSTNMTGCVSCVCILQFADI